VKVQAAPALKNKIKANTAGNAISRVMATVITVVLGFDGFQTGSSLPRKSPRP
jgi:hypothetical protein